VRWALKRLEHEEKTKEPNTEFE